MKMVLPGGMIAVGSGTTATTQSVSLVVAEVAALEHLASTSEIVAEKMDTGGTASAMAPAVGSSTRVRRTG
jgi:hypothetical protein